MILWKSIIRYGLNCNERLRQMLHATSENDSEYIKSLHIPLDMFLDISSILKSLTLDTTICEMDVVGRDRFSIACNCFIRNGNIVTIPVAYLSIQLCGSDWLIAAGPFFPRTSNTTLAIICVIRGKADLDKFYPDNWSCITYQSTHVVFAHMKNPFDFTSCKSKVVCHEDEQRGNWFAFSSCLGATLNSTFFFVFIWSSYTFSLFSRCLMKCFGPVFKFSFLLKTERTKSVLLSINIIKVFLGK